jgi:RNA polymerase sigma factor (TIGR02999 family)
VAETQSRPGEVTQLLTAWSAGDEQARDRLLEIVYDELRTRAQRLMCGERGGHTLNATVLVHEVYLRLVNQSHANWQNRAHFMAVASEAMRRILIDYARARGRAKRGAGQPLVGLDTVPTMAQPPSSPDLWAVSEALESLAAIDELEAKIVELRFFGGLSIAETARVLEISPATTKREWQLARAWLSRRLKSPRDR